MRTTTRMGLRTLGVFGLAEVVWLLTSVLLLVLFAGPDRFPVAALLAVLVVPTAVAALTVAGCLAWFGAGPREGRVGRELALRWSLRDFGIGTAIGFAGLLVTLPAAALWAEWVGAEDATSAVGETFSGRSLGTVAAAVVFLGVWLLAPLGEEVLYRGVLWRAMEHWRWNRWLIFAVTSVVFSVAHLELLRTPLLLVLSIPVGLARLFTGNLLAAVAAHQANNFLPAVALLVMTTS